MKTGRLFAKHVAILAFLLTQAVLTSGQGSTISATVRKTALRTVLNQEYTTLVTIGGVGLRGIIPAVVLVEVEDAIKRYAIDKAQSLLPINVEIASPDDFEITLADFIDVFAGTATGSWIALYLASKGGSGHSAGIFERRDIVEKYGVVEPGTAKGMLVFFNEYGGIIYPEEQASQNIFLLGMNATTPGVGTPLLSNEGMVTALDDLFGNTTLSELYTSCLTTSFDLSSRLSTLFVYDDLVSPPNVGFTRSIRREDPRPLDQEIVAADIVPNYGQDFLVKDIAIGGGATPVIFPAFEVNPINGGKGRSLLADGSLYYGQDILPAVFQVVNSTGDTTLSSLAVLSLGPGLTVPFLADNANGGLVQWVFSGEFSLFTTEVTTEFISKQAEILFRANPEYKPGQYTRIQSFGEVNTEKGDLLTRSRVVSDLPDLEEVGNELVKAYKPVIQSFVEDFIFS